MWTWRSLKTVNWVLWLLFQLALYISLQSRYKNLLHARHLTRLPISWAIGLLMLHWLISRLLWLRAIQIQAMQNMRACWDLWLEKSRYALVRLPVTRLVPKYVR